LNIIEQESMIGKPFEIKVETASFENVSEFAQVMAGIQNEAP